MPCFKDISQYFFDISHKNHSLKVDLKKVYLGSFCPLPIVKYNNAPKTGRQSKTTIHIILLYPENSCLKISIKTYINNITDAIKKTNIKIDKKNPSIVYPFLLLILC